MLHHEKEMNLRSFHILLEFQPKTVKHMKVYDFYSSNLGHLSYVQEVSQIRSTHQKNFTSIWIFFTVDNVNERCFCNCRSYIWFDFYIWESVLLCISNGVLMFCFSLN